MRCMMQSAAAVQRTSRSAMPAYSSPSLFASECFLEGGNHRQTSTHSEEIAMTISSTLSTSNSPARMPPAMMSVKTAVAACRRGAILR